MYKPTYFIEDPQSISGAYIDYVYYFLLTTNGSTIEEKFEKKIPQLNWIFIENLNLNFKWFLNAFDLNVVD